MSHNDSLGVVGASITVGRARRAPTSHKDSLGVVEGGGREEKAPNES